MAKEYVCLYYSYLDAIQPLSDEERGRLLTAILIYGSTGQMPEMTGNERFVFPAIRGQIDRDGENYTQRCEKNARNARDRWNGPRPEQNAQMQSHANASERMQTHATACETCQGEGKGKDKCEGKGEGEKGDGKRASARTTTRFVKPTVEEIAAYCAERGNGIDAQRFFDNYEANGWRRGNTPIKDWKACVRTWERNDRSFHARPAQQVQSTGNVFFDMLREEGGL